MMQSKLKCVLIKMLQTVFNCIQSEKGKTRETSYLLISGLGAGGSFLSSQLHWEVRYSRPYLGEKFVLTEKPRCGCVLAITATVGSGTGRHSKRPISKISRAKGTGGVAQVVECLLASTKL
jgi:hypothetical protein